MVGGAVAKLLLRERNITVAAETLSTARIETEGDTAGFKIRRSEKNETGETRYAYL